MILTTTAVAALGPSALPAVTEAFERSAAGVDSLAEPARPHVLDDAVADVLVRVRGSSVCSGTPIAGTRLVITAAHCVLDRAGDVTAVTVVRDGAAYVPRAILVDSRYHDGPGTGLDAAVLIMRRRIPGPAATLGDVLPTQGLVTLAGFQAIDTDGALLRGSTSHDRPTPKGVTGAVVEIESRPSGCVFRVSSIEIGVDQLKVGCGLIPGASGGGLFAEQGRRIVLLGIISTVGLDLSFNGLTPLAAVHELLDNPRVYTHAPAEERLGTPQAPITRQ
jgi:Trypsin-like peptidase domain